MSGSKVTAKKGVAVGDGTVTHCHRPDTQDKPVNIGSAMHCHRAATTAATTGALKSPVSGSNRPWQSWPEWQQLVAERDDLLPDPRVQPDHAGGPALAQ
jgi:hypothetical protein